MNVCRRPLARISVTPLALGVIGGCSSEGRTLDEAAHPFRMERVWEESDLRWIGDLDGDGFPESLRALAPSPHPSRPDLAALLIQRANGRMVDQVNIHGRVLPLHFLDTDDDGRTEILVPSIRNDSLLLNIVASSGEVLSRFPLVEGGPRVEPDGTVFPWDPVVNAFHLADLTGDGRKELISIVQTGYARLPRGVGVNELPSGNSLGFLSVGSPPMHHAFGEFGTGVPSVLWSSAAVGNGARSGGFDDFQAHFHVASLEGGVPRLTYSRSFGGRWSAAQLLLGDFDGDGQDDVVLLLNGSASEPSSIERLEPGTWRTMRQRTLPGPFLHITAARLGRSSQASIVALSRDGELWTLDGDLEVVERRGLPGGGDRIHTLPDFTGDGLEDLVVSRGAGLTLLDEEMGIRAVISDDSLVPFGVGYTPAAVVTAGEGAPLLLLRTRGGTVLAGRLVPNRFHMIHRHRAAMGGVVGLVVLSGMGLGLMRLRVRVEPRGAALVPGTVSGNGLFPESDTWALMARRVAHDVKNPLTSILLTLQRMRMEYRNQDPELVERLEAYSGRIEERITHLRRLTNNFLKLTHADEPALEVISLRSFVDAHLRPLGARLPSDISFHIRCCEDDVRLRVDREQMESVMENLVANAVDAMPEGGTVSLTCGVARRVHLGAEDAPNDYAILEVLDTGVGMSDEIRRRMFEPGFTTREQGSGLGLAIVRRIVADHRGQITVQSEPSTGTSISVHLPLDGEPSA